MYIDTLTGQQTWNGSQGKFHILWMPSRKNKKHVGLGECHLYLAANQSRGGVARVKNQVTPALVGLVTGVDNQFNETRFDVPEGQILKLSGFTREGADEDGTDEGIKRMAQHYIRMREGAALRMVKMDLPNEHGRARFPFAYIQGQFDLLTLEEAESYGVKTPPAFHKAFSTTRFKLLFKEEIITPETKAKTIKSKAEVKTGDGGKEEVMMFEKVRRIRTR